MWAYRLTAPYTFERVDIPEKTPESLGDRQVLLRFLAAGVCGSDLPGFRGAKGRLPGDTGISAAEMDGFPVHEVVGEVIASRHRSHGVGDRVVGWASGFDGLMEYVVTDGDGLGPIRSLTGSETCRGAAAIGLCAVCARTVARHQGQPRSRHRAGLDRTAVLLCGKDSGRPPRHGRGSYRP